MAVSEKQLAANRANAKTAGRPRLFADKLHRAIVDKAEEEADELSDVLIAKAKTGDVPAIREMFDRALGKALQRSESRSEVDVNVHKMTEEEEREVTGIFDA